MRYDAADIWVKERLCQALASLRIRTCRKYVTLFIILIFSLLFVNSARAESVPSSCIQDGKTIAVQAIVPLTPEFTYGIRKNSSLSLEKVAFALGEEIQVTVRIVGGNDEPLHGHRIRLQVVHTRGEELISISGETAIDGFVYFTFVAGADFLGSDIVRAVDVTYDTLIPLYQEISFLVYEPADGQRQREQATKNGISGCQPFSSGQIVPAGIAAASSANISQNSGTIVTIDSRVALTRAGP